MGSPKTNRRTCRLCPAPIKGKGRTGLCRKCAAIHRYAFRKFIREIYVERKAKEWVIVDDFR